MRISFQGSALPDAYVDGATGRVLTVMDRSRATYAWTYYAVHAFNFPGLTARPILRKGILLLPLIAGFSFSATGVVVGWRRLRRDPRRSAGGLRLRGRAVLR